MTKIYLTKLPGCKFGLVNIFILFISTAFSVCPEQFVKYSVMEAGAVRWGCDKEKISIKQYPEL